jgi:hypothetical protein
VKAVRLEEWQEAADRYLPDTKPKKQRTQAAKRATDWLVANRHACHAGGWVWLPKAGVAGHMGHTDPRVTHVTAAGSSGHTGHIPLKGCDPCDRDLPRIATQHKIEAAL